MPGTIVIQVMIEFNYRVNYPLKPRISRGPAMTDRVFREMTRSAYVAKGVWSLLTDRFLIKQTHSQMVANVCQN